MPGDRQPPVGDARAQEDGVRRELRSRWPGERPVPSRTRRGSATSEVRSISAPSRRAWLLALQANSPPVIPERKPEIVLDPRALPSLAPDCFSLDKHRPQALRGPIDGGAEARRSAPDHDEVVERERGCGGEPEGVATSAVEGACKTRPVSVMTRGRCSASPPFAASNLVGLGVALQLQPPERHLVAGQEVLHLVRRSRPAVPDNPDAVVRLRRSCIFQSSSRSSRTG